jgi:hypothetical protein
MRQPPRSSGIEPGSAPAFADADCFGGCVLVLYQGPTKRRTVKHGKRLGLQPLLGRILPEYLRKSFILQCLWWLQDSNLRLPRCESAIIKYFNDLQNVRESRIPGSQARQKWPMFPEWVLLYPADLCIAFLTGTDKSAPNLVRCEMRVLFRLGE